MLKCLICNHDLKSTKSYTGHLTAKHSMTAKQYYDLYLRKSGEGICPVCGKETRYAGIGVGYKQFCSLKCATPHIQEACKSTLKERYNVENMSQIPSVKEKSKQTMQSRYGVNYACETKQCIKASHTKEAIDKAKQTCLKNYGVTTGFKTDNCIKAHTSNEAKSKRRETNLVKYGKATSFKNNHTVEANEKRRKTNLDRYGAEYIINTADVHKKAIHNAHTKEASAKRLQSRVLNGTFNSVEKTFMKRLDDMNIVYVHNYKSERYPWKCDFYIADLDLFIEINNFWTHGNHFYNSDSKEDIARKDYLYNKSIEMCIYAENIKIWTIRDIMKRDCAIDNKLNYVVLWNKDHIDKFLLDLQQAKSLTGFIDYNDTKEQFNARTR